MSKCKMTPEERLERRNTFDGNLVFGSKEFNSSTGRESHLNLKKKVAPEFVDAETGLLKKDISKERKCPLCGCGKEEAREIFIKDGFPHLKCLSCGMIFVSPVLEVEKLQSLNMNEESWQKVLLTPNQIELDKRKFDYGLDLIESYCPSRGSLLDIGCGPGVFLEQARNRGWKVAGLEFNKWCVKRLKELEIEVADCPIEESNLKDESFECITLWTILEHLADPAAVLKEINKKLAPGGLLVVYVPNADSLAVRMLQEKCSTFAGDSHLNFFNEKTLSRMLDETGYKMLEAETILTEIGTMRNYLSFENPYFGNGEEVLDILTPKYIHDNMLGYALLALAKKSG